MISASRTVLACLVLLSSVSAAVPEELVIPGSGNPEFVLGQLARAFHSAESVHQVTIPPSTGTAGALRDVGEGKTSIGRVGRQLKAEEQRQGLIYVPLGVDAVVFVAGAGVSARSLSRTQVLDIYAGKITDWGALGARPGPIRVIGREVTDASRQAIGRAMPPFGETVFADAVKIVHLDHQMLALSDRYPTSLGFLNRSGLYAAKTVLVPLGWDEIEPTPANLESGRYPIRMEFGLIYQEAALSEAGKLFLQFVGSPAAQRILREYGVGPVLPIR